MLLRVLCVGRFFMQYIKILFSSLHPEFLIRNYVIGLVFVGVYGWFAYVMIQQQPANMGLYAFVAILLISYILFPFSVLVWDEIMRVMFGGSPIALVGTAWMLLAMFMIKFMIKTILFSFAIWIAPFGILYLAYRIKREMNQQQNQWQQNQWHQ